MKDGAQQSKKKAMDPSAIDEIMDLGKLSFANKYDLMLYNK